MGHPFQDCHAPRCTPITRRPATKTLGNEQPPRRVRRREVTGFAYRPPKRTVPRVLSSKLLREGSRGTDLFTAMGTTSEGRDCANALAGAALRRPPGYNNSRCQKDRPLPSGLRPATCRGSTDPISLKNVHWTFFRALDAPKGEGFWGALHPSRKNLFPWGISPLKFPWKGCIIYNMKIWPLGLTGKAVTA